MSNPTRNLFVPWTAVLYMVTGEKTQKIKSKVYNVLITQWRGINSIDINITCFKFEAFTHVEIAIFLQDQNPLVKINNLGELTYNFIRFITRIFVTVKSVYYTSHSLVTRVRLVLKKLLLPGRNFRNRVNK